MTFNKIRCPDPIGYIDGKPVRPSEEMVQAWEKLNNIESTNLGNIGKVIRAAQVAQTTAAGAVEAVNTVQSNANVTPSGSMTVSTNKAAVSVSGVSGVGLSGTATLSVAGGTANYTFAAVATLGGSGITVGFSPSPLTADGDSTVTFTVAAGTGSSVASYRIDVTDSAGSPVTESVNITVAVTRTDEVLP